MRGYRQAVLAIATEALDGEDVTSRIRGLSAISGLDVNMISHEVDEAVELLA